METSRYVVARIAAISVAILVAGVSLALWRAQFDVKREEIGAAEMARLFESLYALENGPAESVEATVATLARIDASGNLRHIQLELRDGDGRALVAPAANAPATPLERAFAFVAPGVRSRHVEPGTPWTLLRDDGRRFTATLSLTPASEQREALDNLVGMVGVLSGYALCVLLAVYWTLKRALAPLQPILGAIAHYERNDFSHRLSSLPFKEMDTIGRALNHLADSLARTQEARRVLSLKLVSSQEDERLRIARELHDEFGQTLTAMRADLAWLRRTAAAEPRARAVVDGLVEHCERMHLDVRGLLARLRAAEPHDAKDAVPLGTLLADLVHSWNARPGQTATFSLDYPHDEPALPRALALGVYRLTQEALTNAVRHAQCTRATVTLREVGADAIEWSVADDGVGIDALDAAMQRGNGLAGLRERVWALGGEIDIGPARAGGERPGLRVGAVFPRPTSPAAPAAPD
ncbi:MAG TPA: histidine kinase [Dokdonella sp.]